MNTLDNRTTTEQLQILTHKVQLPRISSGGRPPCRTASLHCKHRMQIQRSIPSNNWQAPQSTIANGPYQAAELTIGLGDLQCLPGLFQRPSGDLPPIKQERKKLLRNKGKLSTRQRSRHYNDAVDAGGPRARQYGRDVSGVALLAVVYALEHSIFTAVAANSTAHAT